MEEPSARGDVRHRRTRDLQEYTGLPLHQETLFAVPSEYSDSTNEMGKHWELISTSWASLSFLLILIIHSLLYLFLIYGLPTPLTTNNILSDQDQFITERAKSDLIGLAQIGEKIVGSYANEVLAVAYMQNHLQVIQAQATRNKTVQIDVQTCSGAYHLTSSSNGYINVYVNVKNVIARLSDGNSSENAVLVNCHFDSHPSSPGASDDGLNCAVMLEVLRVLSQSSTPLTHDVVFLFNGAEENPLQASHGFITNHSWAQDVRLVLNYDSAGHGGRETLFQAGPENPWLISYYSSAVRHPQGNSLVTDIFESGIVPSDTDFRIFRDFGNIPGLDMAHITGGYVYHTSYDDYNIITDGTYQHTGDNMLSLVKALANAVELVNVEKYASGDAIFYDFLGMFFVQYSMVVGYVINVGIMFLAVYAGFTIVMFNDYRKETAVILLISAVAQLVGIILGLCLAATFAMVLDWCDHPMSWFSNQWLVIGLFVAPALLPLMIINWVLSAKPIEQFRLGIGQRTQLNTQAVTIIWTLSLMVLTILGIKSAYLVAMVVGFPAAANIIASTLKWQRRVRLWILVYIVVGLLIPTMYLLWIASLLYSIIPIMGRSGSQIIPDLYMALMFGAVWVLIGSLWAPLLSAMEQPKTIVIGLTIAAILTLMSVLLTPIGFPYSVDPVNPKPQRFWLIHTERTTYNIDGYVSYNDSGYWIQNLDRNSPRTIQRAVSALDDSSEVQYNCLDRIYCGMPLWKSRDMDMLKKSIWVPAEAPTLTEYTPTTLSGSWNDTSSESRRLYLNISGPSHMRLSIAPSSGVNLTNWSLHDEVPEPLSWNGSSLYLVLYSFGEQPELPWTVWLDLTIPTGTSPVVEIALSGHYLHNITSTSAPYQDILDELPVWVDPLHWTATYKSYIF